MNDLSPFEKLIREFEEPLVSNDKVATLLEYIKGSTSLGRPYLSMFETYIGERLDNNIHPERLLNMANHFEKNKDTCYLSLLINRRVVLHIIYRNKAYDHFYYMCRHDERTHQHILNEMIVCLGPARISEAIRIIETIAPRINIDKHLLFLRVITFDENSHTLPYFSFLEALNIEDQYLLWSKVIETNSSLFSYFSRIETVVQTYMLSCLDKNGDDDIFARAIRASNMPIATLEADHALNVVLSYCLEKIPLTIDCLFKRAELEERYYYLLILGRHKDKKELLKSIVKSKDPVLIDRFFYFYADCPEVRHLTPFI